MACFLYVVCLQIIQLQLFILLPLLLLKTFLIILEKKKINVEKDYTLKEAGNDTREMFFLLQRSVGGC